MVSEADTTPQRANRLPAAAAAGVTLALIVTIGTVFRSLGLGSRMAFDEAASWFFVGLPWDTFWQVMWRFEGNSVAYYLLLRGWLGLGDELVIIRSLSVILGVATVFAIYLLGSRLFSRRAGLFAAVLLAVHGFHIGLSQEARGYAFSTLLLVLSTLLFHASLQKRSRTLSAAYVVVSALACYGHLLSTLVLAAQWLWFVTAYGFGALRSRVWTLVGLTLTTAPTLWYAVAQNGGQIDWIKPLNRWRFLAQVTNLVGGDRNTLIAYAGLGFIAVAYAVLSKREPVVRRHTGLVFAWAVVPVAALVLISPVKSMFIDRYLLMCVPAIVLLAAVAIDRMMLSGKIMSVVGAVLGVAVLGATANASVEQYFATVGGSNPLKDMTHYVVTRQRPGDAVILFTAATYFPYVYYTAVMPGTAHLSAADAAASVVFPDYKGVPSGLQPNPSADQIRAAIAGKPRVWLLMNMAGVRLVNGAATTEPVFHSVLREDFVLQEETPMGIIHVYLYERRSTATPTMEPSTEESQRLALAPSSAAWAATRPATRHTFPTASAQ